MNEVLKKSDQRTATRAHLVATFNRLLLEGEHDRPKVAQIVAEAGVARSTFYFHFDGVEALLDESLGSLLGQLADCLAGPGSRDRFVWLLDHIYENRQRGRTLLTGRRGERAEAQLARLTGERLAGREDARLQGILIAGTVMAALGAWTSGKLSATPETLGDRLLGTARAIIAAPD